MILDNKKKGFLVIFALFLMAASVFAVPSASEKFLEKASEAFEQEDIETAYKYITSALKLSEEDANIVYFAQEIYKAKLDKLAEKYDSLDLLDVQTNLEKYPQVSNSTIKKMIRVIEVQQEESLKEESLKITMEQIEVAREQIEATKQGNQELISKLDSGFKDLEEGFTESAETQKRSTRVIAISIIGIAVLVLLIVLLIVIIVHKGFKQQKIQQENYVQAFRMIAATQNQTNRIMLGGVTDVYGNGSPLKLAGSSTWAETVALPDVEFSKEDEEELQKLAVKCEELGARIDQATKRKNNSKNVSELVYKLSMQLGLTRGLSMVNFCAAMCYDAGFLAVDSELLSADNLTPDQKKAMREHVNLAEKYLDFVPKKYWKIFENAATMHHENMDGTGYPKGKKGDEIPQIARLIRVAESFVSMSSKRNYRQTMDKETAIEKLKEQPDFYDPMVVEVLEQIV